MNRRGFLTGAVVAPLAIGAAREPEKRWPKMAPMTIRIDASGAAPGIAAALKVQSAAVLAKLRDDISRGRIW